MVSIILFFLSTAHNTLSFFLVPHPPRLPWLSRILLLQVFWGQVSSPFHPLHCLSRLIHPPLRAMFFSDQKVRQEVRQWWLLQIHEGLAQWKQTRIQMRTEWGNRGGHPWLSGLSLQQADKRCNWLLLVCFFSFFTLTRSLLIDG